MTFPLLKVVSSLKHKCSDSNSTKPSEIGEGEEPVSWCEDRDGRRVAEWLQFRIDTCNTCTCVEGRRGVEVAMIFRGTQYLQKAFKYCLSTCNVGIEMVG